MAIDSENKRRSAQSYGGGGVYPKADGSLDEYDRRHLTVYRGPLVAAAVFLFRAPVGVAYQLLVADTAGSVLTELKPRLEKVSWVMNEVGKLTFVMAKTDPKLQERYLRFGNRVLLQLDNGLPPWGGVITGGREWSESEVAVEAWSGEALLGWRVTGRNRVFSEASLGSVLQAVLADAEAVAATRLELGTVYEGGAGYSLEYHYDTLADVVAEIVKLGGGVVDVTAREEAGRVVFTVNLYDRRGADKPGVALVEGANVVAARLRDEDTVVNLLYGATDGSGWEDDSRLYGSATNEESVALHDVREGFLAVKVTEQAALEAALEAALGTRQWPRRAVALQVTNREPGRFAEYDLGDGVTLVLPTYGFGGTKGLFRVAGREFFPDEDVCDLVVEEAV